MKLDVYDRNSSLVVLNADTSIHSSFLRGLPICLRLFNKLTENIPVVPELCMIFDFMFDVLLK